MIGIILRIDFEQIGVIVAAKEKNKMLHAMFMLVILTTVIMVLTARTRIESVESGVVPQNYYSLMQGYDIPDIVAKTTRNFNNLFEVPTLFYAGFAVYLALDQTERLPAFSARVFVTA
jgi:hypothetical protein